MRSSIEEPGVAGKCMVVGVAGGADAGGSVEGVDFEAGVVGDDDLAGGVEGVGDGFDAGVAFEGGFVFCGGGDVGEVGEGFDGDAGVCDAAVAKSRSLPGLEVAT